MSYYTLKDSRTPLGFGHLGHAFIFYGVGIAFALTAFCMETIHKAASICCERRGSTKLENSVDKLSDISPADILSATKPTETNATINDVSGSCQSGRKGTSSSATTGEGIKVKSKNISYLWKIHISGNS